MNDEPTEVPASPKDWRSAIWLDVHFWVPLVVLLIGLSIVSWVR